MGKKSSHRNRIKNVHMVTKLFILKFSLFHIMNVYFKCEVQNTIGGGLPSVSPVTGVHNLTWWVSSQLGDICNSNLILKEGRNSYSIYGWVIWGERPNLTTANVKGQTWLELSWFEEKSRKGNQTMKRSLCCESHLWRPSRRTSGAIWNETTDWVLKRLGRYDWLADN